MGLTGCPDSRLTEAAQSAPGGTHPDLSITGTSSHLGFLTQIQFYKKKKKNIVQVHLKFKLYYRNQVDDKIVWGFVSIYSSFVY